MSTTQEPGHEKYSELCALAMSGSLTPHEEIELRSHLEICGECRDEHQRYVILAREGMPWLAQRHATREESEFDFETVGSGAHSAKVKQGIFAKIAASEPDDFHHERMRRSSHASIWNLPVRPILGAVSASLIIVVSFSLYRLNQHTDLAKHAERQAENQVAQLAAEKQLLTNQLQKQAELLQRTESDSSSSHQEIEQLQLQLRAESSREEQIHKEIADLRSALSTAKAESAQQLQAAVHQSDAINARVHELEAAYQSAQAELAKARTERDHLTLRLASLEDENKNLQASNRDQQRQLSEREQFLASDRDIRELMGARQLYMADVFDVSSDSRTRKPYGRVFYTKGRSLIFYAFDLDRQPGIKNAAFQAWGKNESSQRTPVNLGILYQDSDQNRRWVLRFDDSLKLAEVDAIFVTVEPHGGSQKPTGKAFLYASLRHEPNHP